MRRNNRQEVLVYREPTLRIIVMRSFVSIAAAIISLALAG
jgi:hypothetical protein